MNNIKNEDKAEYNVTVNEDDAIIEQALAILEARLKREIKLTITCPDDSTKFLRLKLAEREHEVFAVMFLDNRHQLIEYTEMFNGTIDGASVYPREVLKKALSVNASAVILAHNHPSGIPEPSSADERITVRLKEALGLVDIRTLDHIIVGSDSTVSLAERGIL